MSKRGKKGSFGIVPVNSRTRFYFASIIGDTSVPITLSVGASQVYNSLSISTVLAKAAINLAYSFWGKNLEEIIIRIGRDKSNIEFQLHEERFRMNIERLTTTAEIMSKVLREVEESPNFPSDLRDELKTRLYQIFYEEMESVAEKVHVSTQKASASWEKGKLVLFINKRIEVTLLSEAESENGEIDLFSEAIRYLLPEPKKKKNKTLSYDSAKLLQDWGCQMRVLLDTNIIIHREASKVVQKEIGTLFYWFDRLHYEKCVHPLSIEEIKEYKDASVVETMAAKIKNYAVLKTQAPDTVPIKNLRAKYDKNKNDTIDTSLLNEVFVGRVDLLITEDRKIHRKAAELDISARVFTIDAFLEKAVAENPELTEYKVLAVRKQYFGEIDINDPFFESFKNDYAGFDKWFNKKSDEVAYVCNSEDGHILAFLFVKVEDQNENYSDITPRFAPKRRLKIGTFKVVSNGYKLGERFLKIVFDNALLFNVEEIYVTIFNRTEDQERLIHLLHDWGFLFHGHKNSTSGEELVFIRDFSPTVNTTNPCLTYPYFSNHQKKFVVPIYPEYHTELFPDSILRTESPKDYIENRPNRNAISKVYISRSIERSLSAGDIVVFYRTQFNGPAYYTSVATTIGVVQNVTTGIRSLDEFIQLCRKRSVFTDDELASHWNYNPRNHPFVVNFLVT